jgi:hypothetical protein
MTSEAASGVELPGGCACGAVRYSLHSMPCSGQTPGGARLNEAPAD